VNSTSVSAKKLPPLPELSLQQPLRLNIALPEVEELYFNWFPLTAKFASRSPLEVAEPPFRFAAAFTDLW
jgi:hypothetical protein